MQFQIPQFIDTEDKIIGPLTLKQFIFLAIPGGLSFMMYYFLQTWLWFALSLPLVGLGIALAFLKVNSQSFSAVAQNAVNFYFKPNAYVWQPKNPVLPKNEKTIKESVGEGFSLENLVRGMALKNAWRYIQTGSQSKEEPTQVPEPLKTKERYEIFQKTSGERRAAKRVDYR